ncbi:SDR family oxidoreductase [Nonomuraea jabiensis]|uniref:SDR family oxidoreductase n=1 Tax=Nonomuraea jabiensis TaxID=882448 RepID=UPI003D7039F4
MLGDRPKLAAAYADALPVEAVDPIDVSNAVLHLASDDSRYVTGIALPVDAGVTNH